MPGAADTVAAYGIGPLFVRGAEGAIRSVHGGKYRNGHALQRTAGGVQHGSTATCPDLGALECTLRDGDLRRWTAVDGLPADGMQEVWGSNPHSSTRFPRSKPKFKII
jgi:hypothetical protein